LITSFFGGGPVGTVTAGFFDSGEGGAGVVTDEVDVVGAVVVGAAAVTAASVRPPDGASTIPFEEPPHAAKPTPSATVAGAISKRLGDIERDSVANEFENGLRGDPLEHGRVDIEVRVDR
jgi:hypothetical protein